MCTFDQKHAMNIAAMEWPGGEDEVVTPQGKLGCVWIRFWRALTITITLRFPRRSKFGYQGQRCRSGRAGGQVGLRVDPRQPAVQSRMASGQLTC